MAYDERAARHTLILYIIILSVLRLQDFFRTKYVITSVDFYNMLHDYSENRFLFIIPLIT